VTGAVNSPVAWQQFEMLLELLRPARVEELFLNHGAHSITLTDAADDPVLEPLPGETPLWRQTRIAGLFPDNTDLALLRAELLREFDLKSLPQHTITNLEEREWEREWLRDFRPMQFGQRLMVSPAGFEIDVPDAVVVRLEPGLAFGTGTHATTALCLTWLDGLDLRGLRVLDYGCGSGILSIAALMLGARSADAYDIDPQAISATAMNAEQNGVGDRLNPTLDTTRLNTGYDVVIANILAGPLTEHSGSICTRIAPSGRLALSGILEPQAEAVVAAYSPWIDFEPVATSDGWIRLSGIRKR